MLLGQAFLVRDEGVVIGTASTGINCVGSGLACTMEGARVKLDATAGSGAPTDAKYIVAEANGGLSAEVAPSADDQIPVSDSSTAATWRALPVCTADSSKLEYDTSTNSFSCDTTVHADALASDPTDCGANTFAQSIASSGNLTCAAVNLATADVTGTLPAANGGLGMTTVTDDTVAVANGTTWQSKGIPDCDDSGGNHLNYDTGTNAFSCGTSGSSGTECIYIPLYRWHAITGTTTTTTTCQATTNVGAVANRGDVVLVDMDRFTHAKLLYFGNMAASQSGTVTVALRDIAAGSDSISTTWSTGTSCVNRSSSTTDLTAKTGLVPFTARVGSSTAGDDPSLSSVSVQFCTGSF